MSCQYQPPKLFGERLHARTVGHYNSQFVLVDQNQNNFRNMGVLVEFCQQISIYFSIMYQSKYMHGKYAWIDFAEEVVFVTDKR